MEFYIINKIKNVFYFTTFHFGTVASEHQNTQ